MPNPLFVYVVIANDDGSINIDTNVPAGLEVGRQANHLDILDSSRKITADMTHSRLVDDVLNAVGQLLPAAPPSTPSAADLVRGALLERRAAEASQEAAQEADALTADALKDDPEV